MRRTAAVAADTKTHESELMGLGINDQGERRSRSSQTPGDQGTETEGIDRSRQFLRQYSINGLDGD